MSMKNNIFLEILVVLMAIVTIPSAMAENTFYLDPQDSIGTLGGSTYVDLKLDVDTLPTGNFGSYQVTIEFDDSIVNIPDSEVTLLWGSFGSAGTTDNKISITGTDMTGSGVGTYTLATMRLDGQSTGVSALNFVKTIELNDLTPSPIAYTVTNGTYTIPAASEPDLIVTKIEPSKTIFVDATNVFTVTVRNEGTAGVLGSFDVAWEITDAASTVLASGSETISGLNAGEENSFEFNWKPTVLQNTTVSATADSGNDITESNDANNTLSVTYIQDDESDRGILPLSMWGYGGDEPLANVLSGEVVGDLIYSFGDSVYLGGYNNLWTTYSVNFNLGTDVNQISGLAEGIGSGTVKEARLYMYYNWYRYPDAGRPADPEYVMTMTFNGSAISTAAKYEDTKGFDGYADYKYGTFVYNVTPYVTNDGTYQAVLTNAGEGDAHGTSIYGMALLVIYEDPSKGQIEYHIAEGHDLLRQYYHSGTTGCNYHVLPEDATSIVDMPAVGVEYANTNLFTVTAAVAEGDDMSRLLFNTGEWSSPWPYISDINMGTETRNVASLTDDPNTVAFQDRGDGYSATNAILISQKGNAIDLGSDQNTEVGRHIMVPITANDLDKFYGTVEMNLAYDPEKFDFVGIHSNDKSIVSAYQDDHPSAGSLDISAWNQGGVKGDVVLATVELEVIGGEGTNSDLTLTVDVFEDIYGNTIDAYAIDATIRIINPAGDLQITSATSTPVSSLAQENAGILHNNGRPRHVGDDETVISADVTDSGLGIKLVTVDLTSIGGSANTLMAEISPGHYEVTAKATTGIDATPTFVITATDNGGNTATGTTGSLTIYRRGDVVRNNRVDMGDALFIARYTVGLENPDPDPDHFNFVGDVQPAEGGGDHTTNMGDALFIARYTVGLEPAP